MVNYNDGKWHGWDGGECPVCSKSIIEYAWIDSQGDRGFSGPCYAHEWSSDDERPEWGMIVAFRVIKEHREPREFWIAFNQKGEAVDSSEHIDELSCEGGWTCALFREVIE